MSYLCYRYFIDSMLKSLIAKLNDPFPESAFGKEKVIEVCYVGLFVAGFLFLFNPFGLQNMPLGIAISSLIFGLITVVFGVSYYWFCFAILKLKTDVPSWTLWKWLIFTSLMTCWIAVGNFGYLVLSVPENFDISYFPRMLQYTIMVGITPIVVGGLLTQLNAAKRNQIQAEEILKQESAEVTPTEDKLVVFDVNNEKTLQLHSDDILFIEAMQNYLMVHYIIKHADDDTQNAMDHQIIRSTLSRAAEKTRNTGLVRCHRSFIVNPRHVINITGNAQGLKLQLNATQRREIPVSRSYLVSFKAAMNEVKT